MKPRAWVTALLLGLMLGCAASDDYAVVPQSTAQLPIPEMTAAAIRSCAQDTSRQFARNAYEISFDVEVTRSGVIQSVKPKGQRLDDADLEACIRQELQVMPIPASAVEHRSAPLLSHNVPVHTRGVVANTLLWGEIAGEMLPLLVSVSGVTIIVVVAIVVVAVAVADDSDEESEIERCRKVNEACQQQCLPTLKHSDFGNRFHRCMRQCREAAGCWKGTY